MSPLLIVLLIVWWPVGAWSTIYWWTEEVDLDKADLAMNLLVGLIVGLAAVPLFLVPMWVKHKFPERFENRVIIPRRTH